MLASNDRVSVKLGAELLGVGTGVLYRAVREGRLPALRIGHQLRINRTDLAAFARPARPVPSVSENAER